MQRRAKSTVVIGSIATAVIAVPIVIGIRSSLEAEKTLHAHDLVLNLVGNYVQANSGDWPKSWVELEQVAAGKQASVWKWPDDKAEVESRVHVDFSLSLEEVAKTNSTTFTAVTQYGPSYPANEANVGRLLEIVRSNLPATR